MAIISKETGKVALVALVVVILFAIVRARVKPLDAIMDKAEGPVVG